MRKAYRYESNPEYWNRRWREAERDPDSFSDLSIYPIRYAEMVMDDRRLHAAELGAGLGRLLKHYRYTGYDLVGIERSEIAVDVLRAEDPALPIQVGDVRELPYADGEFDIILAFGLYHNIEEGMERALAETARCLKPGGRFCISMRPDNLEMRLNEWYWRRGGAGSGPRSFHRWLVAEDEFRQVLARHGLRTDRLYRARNVSLLYRIPWLRERARAEAERRSRGYRLNALGRILDRVLRSLFPSQFCNVIVYLGRKSG